MSTKERTFLFSYQFEGARYGFDIVAKDEHEARRRLEAIAAWATYDGELVAKIPAAPGAGLFVRAFAAVANFFDFRGTTP